MYFIIWISKFDAPNFAPIRLTAPGAHVTLCPKFLVLIKLDFSCNFRFFISVASLYAENCKNMGPGGCRLLRLKSIGYHYN